MTYIVVLGVSKSSDQTKHYHVSRIVLANKTVCKLLKQRSNGDYINPVPKSFI